MNKQLFQYVKGKGRFKNQNVGLLMGTCKDGMIYVTTSKANVVSGDVFDKKLARQIVQGRTERLHAKDDCAVVPHSLLGDIVKFEDRCMNYFKVQDVAIFKHG